MKALLLTLMVSGTSFACYVSDVGETCDTHRSCEEVKFINYQGENCKISRKKARCSGVVLLISKKDPYGEGEDCQIRVKKEIE